MRAQAIAFAKKFDKEHGDSMVEGAWLVFEDGSTREINPVGCAINVSDPHEKTKGILKYWQLKHGLAVEEFDNLKLGLAAAARARKNASMSGPPPLPAQIEKLKEIKKKVKSHAKKLAAAEEDFENNIPEQQRQRESNDMENRENCGKFLDEVSAIEI